MHLIYIVLIVAVRGKENDCIRPLQQSAVTTNSNSFRLTVTTQSTHTGEKETRPPNSENQGHWKKRTETEKRERRKEKRDKRKSGKQEKENLINY